MRKTLHKAIVAKLKQLAKNQDGYYMIINHQEQMPAIKHFDVWNNQLTNIEVEQAFALPAVFIEFMPIRWKHLLNGVREADVMFNLHILQKEKAPSRHGQQYEDMGLEHYDLPEEINKALHGLTGSGFDAITSNTSVSDHNYSEIVHSIESFNCHVTDSYAKKPITITTAEIDITFA